MDSAAPDSRQSASTRRRRRWGQARLDVSGGLGHPREVPSQAARLLPLRLRSRSHVRSRLLVLVRFCCAYTGLLAQGPSRRRQVFAGGDERDVPAQQHCATSRRGLQQALCVMLCLSTPTCVLLTGRFADWAYLEAFCRDLTRRFDDVYVFTVPLFLPKRHADGKFRVVSFLVRHQWPSADRSDQTYEMLPASGGPPTGECRTLFRSIELRLRFPGSRGANALRQSDPRLKAAARQCSEGCGRHDEGVVDGCLRPAQHPDPGRGKTRVFRRTRSAYSVA